MFKRLMFLILCLAMLVGMGLATTAAIAGDGMYGEMRYRWEGLKNFDDWSSDGDDNFGFAHLRSRLGYSTEIGERGLFNMSVQNTRVLGFDGFYYTKAGDWMFNGLGSKGSLSAPSMARRLADWICDGIEPEERMRYADVRE